MIEETEYDETTDVFTIAVNLAGLPALSMPSVPPVCSSSALGSRAPLPDVPRRTPFLLHQCVRA